MTRTEIAELIRDVTSRVLQKHYAPGEDARYTARLAVADALIERGAFAAPPFTEAQVEAAARELMSVYEHYGHDAECQNCRDRARLILAAAAKAKGA